jgi:DNA-binding PadR family transcriptional regulator
MNETRAGGPAAIDRHDERILLLLGLLTSQSQHGYQINEFIEHNLGRVSLMKKATAYALLTRMESAGLVRSEAAREGNRPTRRVYSITPAGTDLMLEMLPEVLRRPVEGHPPGDIALMYISHMDAEIAASALDERISAMSEEIAELEGLPRHPNVFGVDLAIERRLTLLRADREWFRQLVRRVREGNGIRPPNDGHP